jgi:hypothetical protein
MTPSTEFEPKEVDEVAAQFVFTYIVAVVGGIGALIAWVFWFRGYA